METTPRTRTYTARQRIARGPAAPPPRDWVHFQHRARVPGRPRSYARLRRILLTLATYDAIWLEECDL